MNERISKLQIFGYLSLKVHTDLKKKEIYAERCV